MSREVVFYGERGILNTIILDTQGDIGKQKQFLRSIVLADKSKLDWVDDVRMIKYFVEPCFDQFGNPDMLTYEFSPKTITAPSTGQTKSYTVTVTYGIDELKRPEGDTKVYSVPEDTVITFTVTSA